MKINEVTGSSGVTLPAMVDMIMRKCTSYIRQVGWDTPMYRGVYPATTEFSITTCPVNRKPKDTPDEFHKLIDDWFFKQYGVRYRSNAVFGTGAISQAEEYGDVYVMYPCGNFNFCWSQDVYDLTKEFKHAMNYVPMDSGVHLVIEGLIDSHYTQTNLPTAIESGNEIMVNCNEYIMVEYNLNTEILKYIQNENTRNNQRVSPTNS